MKENKAGLVTGSHGHESWVILVGGRFHWSKGSLHLKAKETDGWHLQIWGGEESIYKSRVNVTDEYTARVPSEVTGGHGGHAQVTP